MTDATFVRIHKMRIEEGFGDILSEAEELIKQGEMAPNDVIESFVHAMLEWKEYFQTSADVYAKMIDVIESRK